MCALKINDGKTCCETNGDIRRGSKVQWPMNSSNLNGRKLYIGPKAFRWGCKTKTWQIEANMAPVLQGKSIGSDQKTVLKGELLIWRPKNQARDTGTLQLKDSICFPWVQIGSQEIGPWSKVGLRVFYCKTLLTPYVENHNQHDWHLVQRAHMLDPRSEALA
jgi:hypothetical protein